MLIHHDCFARTSTMKFYWYSHKNILYKHVHQKVPIVHENTPRTSRLSSISIKECIEPIPVLWYWILLKELHRPFLSRKSQSSKIQHTYCFDYSYGNIYLFNTAYLLFLISSLTIVVSLLLRNLIFLSKRIMSHILLNVPIL